MSAPSPVAEKPVVEKEPKAASGRRRTSGAGVLTGLLGIVCALLGVVSAPSLFLPLAVAFSAFSLLRSLAVLSVLGTVAAALSCIFTVVGLVLFPWGTEEGGRAAAAAASSAVPATAKPASVLVVPTRPAEPEAATGALSMPPQPALPPAPKPEATPSPSKSEAAPPAEAKPAPAPSSSAASSEGPVTPRLEDALPEPPPPAAAVVPDMPASRPTPLEAEKPAEEPKAAKAVAMQPWPENRTEQTKAIQILLRDLDFYHGTTNGTFGPATRAAICLYLVTYDEKGECEPSEALFDSLQKRRAATGGEGARH
jgi:hypothetical protein